LTHGRSPSGDRFVVPGVCVFKVAALGHLDHSSKFMASSFTSIVKSCLRRVVPRRAQSSLRLWLSTDWQDREPRLVKQFTADPVLVLAPHPDDEVIGPGGTVRLHVLASAPVYVVIMTDGRFGGYDPDGTLCKRRKEESVNAAKLMGTREPIFLDAPDTALTETKKILDDLAKVFVQYRPKFVYLPALTDNHPDHWATNRVLYALLHRLPLELTGPLIIRGYEVWSPVLANLMVDISETADLKRQAINAFPSQTSIDDYASATLALNQYRSLRNLHGRGHAEAFMELNANEFKKLFEAASLRHEPR
jgi:N-acetylglucosamine malate deacetylase 1